MRNPEPKAYAPLHAIYKSLFFLFLLLTFSTVYAQLKVWTWMNGSNTGGPLGVYGTKGVADAANAPRCRSYHASCKDADGNIWVFGGHSSNPRLNDLWKFTVSTGQWTWMSGDSADNVLPDFGTMGVASASNKVGAKTGAGVWYLAGYIYVFGGFGPNGNVASNVNLTNDLWRFNINTQEWTWIHGTTFEKAPGVYGIKGVADAANMPGARDVSAYWSDADGNLWLFGGLGYDATGTAGLLNDLWKYDVATNRWTWVSGSDVVNATGIYGTKGTAAAVNIPGGRRFPNGWVDGVGNIWIFAGGSGTSGNIPINDLWKYDVVTNEWTWVNGDPTYSVAGVYGTKGVPAVTNKPGARHGSVVAVDANNTVWVFSGVGVDANGNSGYLNDLWSYDMTTGQWTWQSGPNTRNGTAVYGTQGVANVNNMPGGRYFSTAWMDGAGNFWMLGGSVHPSYYNDLWKYSPLQTLPLRNIALQGVHRNNNNVLTWQTIDEENTQKFMVERSEDGAAYSVVGTVAATGSGNNKYAYTDPIVSDKMYFYRLQVADRDGQTYYSSIVTINAAAGIRVKTYPNPASKGVTVEMSDRNLLNTSARIYTAAGQLAGEVRIATLKQYIDLHRYAKGVLTIRFYNGKVVTVVKE